MKLTKEMCKVIADLEYIVGSKCYNPNSYDGWNDEEGCSFRYPVNVPNKNDKYIKIRGNITESPYRIDPEDIDENAILNMIYKFGSNQLYIGQGIVSILNYLEERYDLDFWELEKKHKNN